MEFPPRRSQPEGVECRATPTQHGVRGDPLVAACAWCTLQLTHQCSSPHHYSQLLCVSVSHVLAASRITYITYVTGAGGHGLHALHTLQVLVASKEGGVALTDQITPVLIGAEYTYSGIDGHFCGQIERVRRV